METTYQLPIFREGISKSKIKELANASIELVLEEGNPIQIAEAISAMEDFVTIVRKDPRFVDYLRDELAKNQNKLTTASGAKIEACEVGTKYNFNMCGDPVYRELMDKKIPLDEEIKKREAFLKTIPAEGLEIRHEDELVKVYPPSKSSTSSFKVTLAK